MRGTIRLNDLNDEQLQVSSDILRALAHPLRMKIIQFIDHQRTVNVNKIYSALKLEQSITSQHLKVLRMAGIVHTHREGKYIHYTLDYPLLGLAKVAVDGFFKDEAVSEWAAAVSDDEKID